MVDPAQLFLLFLHRGGFRLLQLRLIHFPRHLGRVPAFLFFKLRSSRRRFSPRWLRRLLLGLVARFSMAVVSPRAKGQFHFTMSARLFLVYPKRNGRRVAPARRLWRPSKVCMIRFFHFLHLWGFRPLQLRLIRFPRHLGRVLAFLCFNLRSSRRLFSPRWLRRLLLVLAARSSAAHLTVLSPQAMWLTTVIAPLLVVMGRVRAALRQL